jgi:galactose-1-phosphate uridylyltransferase
MDKKCILCDKSHNETPVTKFEYRNSEFYICPKHIPVLIHDPQKLTGLLPDAENFEAG